MAANFFKIRKGLTLDPVSGADPVGNDGDIYYNSTLAKFRKFQNGAWSDLDTGGGGGGNAGWIAQEIPILAGSTSLAVSFPSTQPDTSYVVLAQLTNYVDANPQFQQVISIVKTPGGFTASWNAPTDSSNYNLSYIVPIKVFQMREVSVPSGASSYSENFLLPTFGPEYGIMAALQNTVDGSPQFQTTVVTAKSGTGFTANWNSPTDSANYKLVYVMTATGQQAINLGDTSATAPLPVDYGTTNYSVIAMMHNLTDPFPQFQPMVITAKNASNFTVSWPDPADSANYVLMYYAISYSS